MVTGSAIADRVVLPTTAPQDDVSGREADAVVRKALAQAVTHLRSRFPTASDTLVLACVNEAFDPLRTALVRLYLAILIERSAGRALAEALERAERGR